MEGLNDQQQAAIKASAVGHVSVIAGPGTGKTQTLIGAVLDKLENGAPAEDLLILTFTRKAADELTARLGRIRHDELPLATTFHAWAYQQVKCIVGGKRLIDNFTHSQCLLELKNRIDTKRSPRELALIISRTKNGGDHSPRSLALLQEYDEILALEGLIDFDDLLRIYLDNETRTRYTDVLVDEFQDTSPLQYRLLKHFIHDGAKLFVIGDPNQSIYGFRGADGEAFDAFIDVYKPYQVRLTRNYRSARTIIEAATGLFPEATQIAVTRQAGAVRIIETLDVFSEADCIVRMIEQALGGTDWLAIDHDERSLAGDCFSDFAVLYRQNQQGRLIAKRLRAAGFPVQVTGEDSPYNTPLAQTILAEFIYLEDPSEEARQRVAYAGRLLGATDVLTRLDELDTELPPIELATAALEQLGQKDTPMDFQVVLNSLAGQPSLTAAVSHWQTLAEQEFYDPKADFVTLSTIHASKGLQFRHVFVAGCDEGILPYARNAVTEEKRLFYVAITRAIESASLLYYRRFSGRSAQPSSFLSELSGSLTRQTDEAMDDIMRRRARRRNEHSQQSLF